MANIKHARRRWRRSLVERIAEQRRWIETCENDQTSSYHTAENADEIREADQAHLHKLVQWALETDDTLPLPDRVIINREGEGAMAVTALRLGVISDIIFIRNDGWTLGAPREFEDVAYKLWATKWVAVRDAEDAEATLITEYQPRRSK